LKYLTFDKINHIFLFIVYIVNYLSIKIFWEKKKNEIGTYSTKNIKFNGKTDKIQIHCYSINFQSFFPSYIK